MRIILAIFAGGIIYLLFHVLGLSDSGEKKVITKRLDQIAGMGEIHGERKIIKKQSFVRWMVKGIVDKIVTYVGTVLPITAKERMKMEQLIIQGGLQMVPEEYVAFEIVTMMFGGLVGIALGLLIQSSIFSGFGIGVLFGYTCFRYYIKKRIGDRQKLIRKQLPEAVDMLSLCVESGLSFNQGMQYLLEKSKGPLINEFELALKRMNLGETRRMALESMAEHCCLEEVTVFTSAVVQAEELGLPLRDILVTQARQGRIMRRMKIEEAAQKLPVKIMFPLIFLVLPTLFIVILGPAVPQIMQML